MTSYETIMVVLGLPGLLVASERLLIALLDFLEKRKHRRK